MKLYRKSLRCLQSQLMLCGDRGVYLLADKKGVLEFIAMDKVFLLIPF